MVEDVTHDDAHVEESFGDRATDVGELRGPSPPWKAGCPRAVPTPGALRPVSGGQFRAPDAS